MKVFDTKLVQSRLPDPLRFRTRLTLKDFIELNGGAKIPAPPLSSFKGHDLEKDHYSGTDKAGLTKSRN